MKVREPCDICEKWDYLETHHIFEGIALRRVSERYSCVIRVCRSCHDKIHNHPLDYLYLKRQWQREVMARQGWTLDDWRKVFGKSYISEEVI